MANTKSQDGHRWRFFRAGGVDQVRLDTGADILNLPQLDQKLWVALSCPTKGLEFDSRTLELLDGDGDGRVRAPEILAAVRWLDSVLKTADVLTTAQDGMPLAAIDAAKPEGKRVLASAQHILTSLGKGGATSITVADTTETARVFAGAKHNGDGVVPPDTIDDPVARQVADEVVACLGGEMDRSGRPGITAAKVDAFFAALEAFAAWWQQAEADRAALLPLGEGTAAAHAAVQAVRAKVDDYFGRCRLAAFDQRAKAALNREEQAYLAVAAQDLSITVQEIAGFPLAAIEAGKPLPLDDGVNPAWAAALAALRDSAVRPLLGTDERAVSEAEWLDVCGRLAPYAAWHGAKVGTAVEKLGIARVREVLAGGAKEMLGQAIAAELAVTGEVEAMAAVERLVRYGRDLHRLLNNYVSFTDFYARRKAVFQVGRLYLDQRSCDLCFRVDDAAKHGALAAMAKTFLAYCDCVRPSGEKMTIAAAFTAGDCDFRFAGRNGGFYDRRGRDWDATITRVVEHPISIGQAFFAPYKRVLRWIEEGVAKRAAAADSAAGDKLSAAATATGEAAAGKPSPKPKFDVGVVAALGVAVGGITAALGAIMSAFFGLGFWMPLGVLALVLLISGPAMVVAWLKLRQRNLGPILDASGWAVNGRVKVNIPLGASLTERAVLPAGAERSLADPYAEKKRAWPKVVLVLLILGAILWGLDRSRVLDRWAWYKRTREDWLGPRPAAATAATTEKAEGTGAFQNK